jgi:putative lipoprotein (rSAM/lipoprotein system)
MAKTMKRVKRDLLKTVSLIISGILNVISLIFGIQAISSCHQTYAYGTLSTEFEIGGKVTDAATDAEIKGLQVSANSEVGFPWRTTLTDNNGNYEVFFEPNTTLSTFILSIKDIDGTSDGNYHDKDVSIDVSGSDLKDFCKGDIYYNFCSGRYVRTINIKINK